MTEAQFQAQVEQLAALFGWATYHTRDSRKSREGFPDLIMLRRGRLVVAELKVGDNAVTPEQQGWLDAFELAEVETYVWRPEDWKAIQEILR